MSAVETFDHAAEARKKVQHLSPGIDGVGVSVDALTHATLALVEQQRIANLIALLSGGDETAYVMNGALNLYNRDNWENVRAEIRKGLGL